MSLLADDVSGWTERNNTCVHVTFLPQFLLLNLLSEQMPSPILNDRASKPPQSPRGPHPLIHHS